MDEILDNVISIERPPSRFEYWVGIAEAVSRRSPDEETKVGAILVKNDTGMIVATAHNGFVRGAPDKNLPKRRPEKYKYMVHAEENLIAHCAKSGISVDNCTVVLTISPCQKCLRLLFQAGITDVICKDLYRDHCIDMEDVDILQTKTDEGYYRLKYVVSN